MAKNTSRYAPKDRPSHKLDLADIDDRDEIDGEEQLSLVWCITHQKYEWHWLGDTTTGQ